MFFPGFISPTESSLLLQSEGAFRELEAAVITDWCVVVIKYDGLGGFSKNPWKKESFHNMHLDMTDTLRPINDDF
jgi:hypothetical protein